MSFARPRIERLCSGLAALAALVPLACLAAAPPGPAGEEIPAAMPSQDREPPTLRTELERALDPAGRAGLRLFVECYGAQGRRTVELFGSGVAIWNGARQFAASPEEIGEALAAVLAAGFPEMAPTYGGEEDGRRSPRPPAGGGPVRLVCALEIEAGGAGRRVEQIAGGAEHEPLLELARGLLARWRAAGEAGLAAAGLDDGLARIARGELAPETLRLTLHEKPELGGGEGTGYLLRLRGREVTSRPFATGSGYGPPRPLELTPEELRRLAGRMAALSPGRLPVNLFAPDYLDLTIEVLGHRVSVQARRFTGMTATTHGAVQRDFDRLLEALRVLGGRVPELEPPGSP